MSQNTTMIQTIALAGTKEGMLSVAHIESPYGEGSAPVVSLGVSLKGDEGKIEWKTHIPYENIDEVISALIDAKQRFGA